jgi:hypothetical protein
MHSPGLILAQTGPTTAELCARPRPRGKFAQGPLQFRLSVKNPRRLFNDSLTVCRNIPVLLTFLSLSPQRRTVLGAELRRARPAGRRDGWSSRATGTQLNSFRSFPPNQFYCWDYESIGPRWPSGWVRGWTHSEQTTARTTDLRLGKGSRVHQGLRTFFDLGRTRPEERVNGEGVTAALNRADTRSGDGLWPNSNCWYRGQ